LALYLARDRVYSANALLLERVRNFCDATWPQHVHALRPALAGQIASKSFVGLIASGDKLIASAEFRSQLLKRGPKSMAEEIENQGVFAAVFEHSYIRGTLAIRSVCDMASKLKADDWQEYTANTIATCAIGFPESALVKPMPQEV
jgi:nucleoside phosphorylase